MMLFKLSLRNIRRSIRNYVIYFATLILGVAIFYVFNSLGTQTIMLKVSNDTRDIIGYMMDVMSVVSIFVSVVLGFLIVYASSFLMKRRKKEFGIYMLLGMGKAKVSLILVMETVLIGILSLGVGLLLGIAASQGMSIIVANMFEADMTSFEFMISKSALWKTLVYFVIMYAIVILLDAIVVGKAKLITLIQSGKHSQKNHAKNPFLCIIVFVIACIMLGSAYYNVTAGVNELEELSDIGIQIVKGIVSTFLIFWSLSGLLLVFAKRCKRFYYKGVNSFSVQELGNRINTTVFSGSIICLLLFFTICILSSAMAVKNATNVTLRACAPMDVQFSMLMMPDDDGHVEDRMVQSCLEKYGIDMTNLTDVTELTMYSDMDITMADVLGDTIYDNGYEEGYIEVLRGTPIQIVYVSEYNRFLASFGADEISLADDEYAVICNYEELKKMYDKGLSIANEIEVDGKLYKPRYHACVDGFVSISNSRSNGGFLLVPDSMPLQIDRISDDEAYCYSESYLSANYVVKDEKERDRLNEYFSGENIEALLSTTDEENSYITMNEENAYIGCVTKQYLYDTSIGMTAMVIFVGIYLGIVFLISGAAILSLKELSEAADNKEKYQILRRLGVDEKQLRRSLLAQSGVFFGMPLLLAVIHSVFGMQTAMFILSVFGKEGLTLSILTAAGIILVIYGIYFLITYLCSRKIISEA